MECFLVPGRTTGVPPRPPPGPMRIIEIPHVDAFCTWLEGYGMAACCHWGELQ